jgi:hypothetical protein
MLFGLEKQISKIKLAVQDMQYLLTRGYAEKAASDLVGNRYRLKPDRYRHYVELQHLMNKFSTENRKNRIFQI